MGKRSRRRKVKRQGLHRRAEAEALPQNRRGEFAETPVATVRVRQWPLPLRTW